MIKKSDFEKNFLGLTIPDELIKLLDFQNNISKNDFFAEGFELNVDEDKHGLKTFSENEEFLKSILEFAIADGTGATYGFWRINNSQDLNEVPIVAFGSEGEFSIVAESCFDLFKILAFDTEPIMDWNDIHYTKTNDKTDGIEFPSSVLPSSSQRCI